jgi:hypothetical protein
MKGTFLQNLTPEQREELKEKARISRLAKAEDAKKYKADWQDLPHWKALASKAGIRLPNWTKAPTTSQLQKYCKLLSVDYEKHVKDNYACNAFTRYANDVNQWLSKGNNGVNVQYNMVAYVGFLLEEWNENT